MKQKAVRRPQKGKRPAIRQRVKFDPFPARWRARRRGARSRAPSKMSKRRDKLGEQGLKRFEHALRGKKPPGRQSKQPDPILPRRQAALKIGRELSDRGDDDRAWVRDL